MVKCSIKTVGKSKDELPRIASVCYLYDFEKFILRITPMVYLKINETLIMQIKSEVMSGTRTHPKGNTRDLPADNLFIESFSQGLVHIKVQFLSLSVLTPV